MAQSSDDRAYEVYRDIARLVFRREPLSRERWDALSPRSLFRSALRSDDGQFDADKEHEGDAQ